MNKAHSPINWQNKPSVNTPINETNLNKMDSTIGILDDRIIAHDTSKLDKSTANTMVKSISFDESTGVFTITLLNGSTTTIDTKLEKLAVNFSYDVETQQIVLELIDGTKQYIDISALITQYEFTDSDTIGWEVAEDGTVKAKVLDGSITEDMLQPNYLADIKVETAKSESYMNSAKKSEINASSSANLAQSYAVGGTGTRDGEDTDNAKYYSENAQPLAQSVSGNNPTATNSTNAPLIYLKNSGYTEQDGEPTPDNPIDIVGLGDGGTIEVKTCGKNIFGGIKLAQAIVNSGSANVVLDESAGTVTFFYNTNHLDTEKSILFDKFKENTQYTIILKGNNTNNGDKLLYTTNIRVFYSDNSTETITLDTSVDFNIAFVTSENKTVKNVKYVYNDTDRNVLYYNQCGIFEGVITEEEFETYQETAASIPIDSPLYDGDYIEVYADGSGKLVRNMYHATYKKSDFTAELYYYMACLNTYPADYYGTINDKNGLMFCNIASNICNPDGISTDAINAWLFTYSGSAYPTVRISQAVYNSLDNDSTVEFVYRMKTPTEESLTAEQVEAFKQLYTFDNITNVSCDGEIAIRYYCNTDGGDTVGMLQKEVSEFNKIVGGTVDDTGTDVTYYAPTEISDGALKYEENIGGTLVDALRNATSKISEFFNTLIDFLYANFPKEFSCNSVGFYYGKKVSEIATSSCAGYLYATSQQLLGGVIYAYIYDDNPYEIDKFTLTHEFFLDIPTFSNIPVLINGDNATVYKAIAYHYPESNEIVIDICDVSKPPTLYKGYYFSIKF